MYDIIKESVVDLLLPWAPSINNYWGHRVHAGKLIKFLSSKAKTFREDVKEAVQQDLEHCHRFVHSSESRLAFTIFLYCPDYRKRDIDNIQKSVLDALQHAGVFYDDSQIDALYTIRTAQKIEEGICRVQIARIFGTIHAPELREVDDEQGIQGDRVQSEAKAGE